jgi:transcriptional regulator with XRE-family HTH domain
MNPQRLKAARERAGLTQAEVAQRLGVSKALPGHWENGVKTPSLGKIEAVAKLLNVSVSWLMDDSIGKEPSRYDDREPASPDSILSDYLSPPGLRDLASNKELIAALDITADEWASLRSLKVPPEFTVHGYVAVLMAIRGNVTES